MISIKRNQPPCSALAGRKWGQFRVSGRGAPVFVCNQGGQPTRLLDTSLLVLLESDQTCTQEFPPGSGPEQLQGLFPDTLPFVGLPTQRGSSFPVLEEDYARNLSQAQQPFSLLVRMPCPPINPLRVVLQPVGFKQRLGDHCCIEPHLRL